MGEYGCKSAHLQGEVEVSMQDEGEAAMARTKTKASIACGRGTLAKRARVKRYSDEK